MALPESKKRKIEEAWDRYQKKIKKSCAILDKSAEIEDEAEEISEEAAVTLQNEIDAVEGIITEAITYSYSRGDDYRHHHIAKVEIYNQEDELLQTTLQRDKKVKWEE